MIDELKVYNRFLKSENPDEASDEQVHSACRRAVCWIEQRLKDDADDNGELVLSTACAMAKFYLCCSTLDEDTNFSAGDVSISSGKSKLFEKQLKILEIALSQASDILKDGGFCFVSS
ncbi:MAG: hypothetical protein ACI4GY_08740 [Acutalibacteraceae bacterium]